MPSDRSVRVAARGLTLLGVILGGAISVRAQMPPVPEPVENPTTPDKALLGKILFWDEQLSSDGTMACGTCHVPSASGTDPRDGGGSLHPGPDGMFGTADDVRGSRGMILSDAEDRFLPSPLFGFDPQVTRRRSPSVIVAAFAPELLWDGSVGGTFHDPQTGEVAIAAGGALENQAARPPVASVEMGHQDRSWGQVIGRLESARPLALARALTPDLVTALGRHPSYPDLFEQTFGDAEITARRIAFALAAYQRTLIPDRTPFDLDQLTDAQRRGAETFFGRGFCSVCHRPPLFTSQQFRNIGLVDPAVDPGRSAVTGNPSDRGKFKIPTLRNAGLRSRFFHDGVRRTLEEVIDFYDRGGDFADNLDRAMFPRMFTFAEKRDLLDFVANALTDPRVALELPPFDRPRLASESVPPNPAISGDAVVGTGGIAPVMIAASPPAASGFKVGVGRGRGGAMAFLVVSPADGGGGPGFETPARDVPGLETAGRALFLHPGRYRVRLEGRPADPGGGYATIHFRVPASGAQAGRLLHARWIVFDPAAPGGLAMSRVAEIRLPGRPGRSPVRR